MVDGTGKSRPILIFGNIERMTYSIAGLNQEGGRGGESMKFSSSLVLSIDHSLIMNKATVG